jgi:hypothetical protein
MKRPIRKPRWRLESIEIYIYMKVGNKKEAAKNAEQKEKL